MKCVYKIICRDKEITEFYIGSSVNFDRRIRQHKSNCNNLNRKEYCYPLYMFINVNGGYNNWEIVVIKEYKFITKEELEMNEQKYKELLKPELNSKNAKGWDIQRRKNHMKKYDKNRNSIRVNCLQCNKELNACSLNRHKKRFH
tara:strand:+ start:105 stop:536 length:432 start_codon:yes stop_codon:yes gene_type:complete